MVFSESKYLISLRSAAEFSFFLLTDIFPQKKPIAPPPLQVKWMFPKIYYIDVVVFSYHSVWSLSLVFLKQKNNFTLNTVINRNPMYIFCFSLTEVELLSEWLSNWKTIYQNHHYYKLKINVSITCIVTHNQLFKRVSILILVTRSFKFWENSWWTSLPFENNYQYLWKLRVFHENWNLLNLISTLFVILTTFLKQIVLKKMFLVKHNHLKFGYLPEITNIKVVKLASANLLNWKQT